MQLKKYFHQSYCKRVLVTQPICSSWTDYNIGTFLCLNHEHDANNELAWEAGSCTQAPRIGLQLPTSSSSLVILPLSVLLGLNRVSERFIPHPKSSTLAESWRSVSLAQVEDIVWGRGGTGRVGKRNERACETSGTAKMEKGSITYD